MAIEGAVQEELRDGAAAAVVSDVLVHVGCWWLAVDGPSSAGAERVLAAARELARKATGGSVPLAALHLGVMLADRGACEAARAPPEEAARMAREGACTLPAAFQQARACVGRCARARWLPAHPAVAVAAPAPVAAASRRRTDPRSKRSVRVFLGLCAWLPPRVRTCDYMEAAAAADRRVGG